MKKHFVFDLDDTLTNSYEFNQQMFVDTFVPHFPDISTEILRDVHKATRGQSMDAIFKRFIDELKLDVSSDQLREENEKLHQEKVKDITLFEGLIDLFKEISKQDKKVSICTNRQYGSLQRILEFNKIESFFTHVVSCRDEGHEKPDPFCLLEIIENEGGNKEEFIYFGDSETDSMFAKNADVDFVIVDHYLNDKKFYRNLVKSFL